MLEGLAPHCTAMLMTFLPMRSKRNAGHVLTAFERPFSNEQDQ